MNMRLWSLHPKYLDTKGLLALWREGLLAKKVIEGKTKGYRHHPQLKRFQAAPDPLAAINAYLQRVVEEAERRAYAFDRTKLDWAISADTITVTRGQVIHEGRHLMKKLHVRDTARADAFVDVALPDLHPLFVMVEGDIEPWEVLSG